MAVYASGSAPDYLPDEAAAAERALTVRLDQGAAPAPSASHDSVKVLLAAADALALLVAAALVGAGPTTATVVGVSVFLGLVAGGEHRNRLTFDALADLPRLFRTMSLSLVVLAVAGAIFDKIDVAAAQGLASVGAVIVGRLIVYSHIRSRRRQLRFTRTTVIVGGGSVGLRLFDVFRAHPEYGVNPVAIIDDVAGPRSHLDVLTDVWEAIGTFGANHIVVAFGPTPEQDIVTAMRSIVQGGIEVHVVPRFFEVGVAPRSPVVESARGITLLQVRQAALRASAFRTKRAVDVLLSGAALLVLAPVLATIAVLVRLSSSGPVLFRQRRIGLGARTFDLLKFRSMSVNDDSDTRWSVGAAPEVTRVGAVLRRLSLDELPQLYNVFIGDMSLVGPRPERPFFVQQFGTNVIGYEDRHRLPVGLTGLSQINGLRGDTSIAERARFDNYYVENWSLWLDVVVLFRTAGAVVRHALSSED